MHITLVDGVIIFLAIGALLRGYQIGFIRQVVSTIAFVLGLFPGSWLSSFAMEHISGPSKPLAGLAVLLSVCFALMTIGETLAVRLKLAVGNRVVQRIDNGMGAVMSVVTLVLGVWLASAIFALAPPSSLQSQLKNSSILGALNAKLPPASALLSSLNKLVDPNQSPEVFAGREPSPDARHTLPDPDEFTSMLRSIELSVLKIEGLGCGGIVDGSGFVFAPELVVTNAHVVAGVDSPKVRAGTDALNTTVVLFDPANDIAVLRVPGLNRPALTINRMNPATGSAAFALGYPGGGEYQVSPAVVLDRFEALGKDIYGKSRTTREVYSLQTTIVRGNSGGPVVASDGTVLGVVFATSTTYNNIGYALTMEQVQELLRGAQDKQAAVNTGKCSE